MSGQNSSVRTFFNRIKQVTCFNCAEQKRSARMPLTYSKKECIAIKKEWINNPQGGLYGFF